MNKNNIFKKMYNTKRNYLIPILNTNNNISSNIKPVKDIKSYYNHSLRNIISSSNISYRKNTKKSNIRYIDNYQKHKSNSLCKINIFNDSELNTDNDIKIPNKPKKNKLTLYRNNSQNYLVSNPSKTKPISTLINQKNKSQIFSCLETKNYYELINNTKYLANDETAPTNSQNSKRKIHRCTSQPKVNFNNNSIFRSRNIEQLNNDNNSKIGLYNSDRENSNNKNNCNINNYYVIDKKPLEKKHHKNKSYIFNNEETHPIFNLNKIKKTNYKKHNNHNNSVIIKINKEENYAKKIDTFNNIYFNNSSINSNNDFNKNRILLADDQNSPKIVDNLKSYKEMVINKLGIKNNNLNNNNNKDTKLQTKTQTVSSISLSTSVPNSLNPKKIYKQNNYNNKNNKNISMPAKPLMTNEMLSFPMEDVDDNINDNYYKKDFKNSNVKKVNKKNNISYGPEEIHYKFVELHKYQKKFYKSLEKNIGNHMKYEEPEEAKYFENYDEKVPII